MLINWRKGPGALDFTIRSLFIDGRNGIIGKQSDLSPFVMLNHSQNSMHH